ncbi:MAG: ankyrin repeat domain-containing protein [Mailhella sp.]|nr:ankyrin repeat domain-containing protein [Mailhella sp.]
MTPLHVAARKCDLKNAAILIASGADVNVKDCNDYTPSCIAAAEGHLDMVKLLVANGAVIVQLAISRAGKDVAAYLEQAAGKAADGENA